ncbi:MAG: adenylate/guanylate cyclase domain-containing protein, partial [bacterium]|nr:adenylate/guanylate cyclase domain-containing protein [bacterium]
VEAVRCAVEAQRQLAERNTDLPEDRRIEFRIGVNLGDVVVEGDNLMGDAVNVAARLQELSEPGGIHVSASVFDQVEGKLDLAFNDLGAQQVKNIVKPVRVYRVPLGEITGGGAKGSSAPLPLPDKPSIAVLPFTNMSGDIEHEYFSDGISEDVITDLSRISGLFVISRSSSFTFKGRSVNLRDISRELGARYVVEGSVRRAGDRVRITAQLVDGTTGGHLWAERYDRDLADIFAVQDDVTRKIVTALKLRLTADEKHRLLVRGTSNVEAYEHVLRGREFLFRDTPADNIRARESFGRSVSLDPGYAVAWMLLGETHLAEFNMGWDLNPDSTLGVAHHLMSKALELGPDLPSAHTSLGKVLVWQKKHGQALASIERSIELDPNDAEAHGYLAFVLNWAGDRVPWRGVTEVGSRRFPARAGMISAPWLAG